MKSVLIASKSDASIEYLKNMLGERAEVTAFKDGNSARRAILERDFDLAVINSPLLDEFGVKLAKDVIIGNQTEVILLVKSDLADEVAAKTDDFGIFTLAKPISKEVFVNTVRLTNIMHKRIINVGKEKRALTVKIEDIKFIDRAKLLLIEKEKMSEEEAHKFIEKNAMERRLTKREIADELIARYK